MAKVRNYAVPGDNTILSQHGLIRIVAHHDTLSGNGTVWALPGRKKTASRMKAERAADNLESMLMGGLDEQA